MNQGRTVFAQLLEYAPHKQFQRCVERYDRHRRAPRFSYWDQFLAMAFAQVTFRESLRDIEACLRAAPGKLYWQAPVSWSSRDESTAVTPPRRGVVERRSAARRRGDVCRSALRRGGEVSRLDSR
jgi:hypothetical protein